MRYKYDKIILVIFILRTFCTGTSFAQNDNDNHRKYWYYKSRLNNDFVKVGTQAGESIPFRTRADGAHGPGDISITNNTATVDHGFATGDETANMGQYIAVLATEYHLLKQNNQNTDIVKHELYCALNALDRVDMMAETTIGGGLSPSNVNGFLVKDDMPNFFKPTNPDKEKYYEHFNYFNFGSPWTVPNSNHSSRGFMSQYQAGVASFESAWMRWEVNHATEIRMSQDDYHDILLGLVMVVKFVDINAQDGNNVQQYASNPASTLVGHAKNIAKRLVDQLREPKNLSGQNCTPNWWNTGWEIKYPTSCATPTGIGMHAEAFSYPLAEIERIILDGYSAPVANVSLMYFNSSPNPHGNGYSGGTGFNFWNGVANSYIAIPFSPYQNVNDVRHFTISDIAACNCAYGFAANTIVNYINYLTQQVPILNYFGILIGYSTTLVQTIVSVFVPGFYYNTSSSAILANSYVPNA